MGGETAAGPITGSEAGEGRKRKRISGSMMSSRQLARTVVDGKLLTFRFSSGEDLVGYLAGMDDFHWLVLTSEGCMVLVHKGSASRISVAAESTYDDEERLSLLEQVVRPFREYLVQENLVPAHSVRPNASRGT